MTLRIKQPGLFSSLQDGGRRGLRSLGIPWAGVGCSPWMRFANALLNQDQQTPVIETIEAGLSMTAVNQGAVLSLIGDVDAEILHVDGSTTRAQGWRSHALLDGESLTIKRTGRYRCAVVGIKGLTVSPHFGSVSTYPSAKLGGLSGSILATGDELPIQNTELASSAPDQTLPPLKFPGELESDNAAPNFVVRAVPGPQDDAFTQESLDQFFSEPFTVSSDIDRMGARLTGPTLRHRSDQHRDPVSDAILPGSVQVPGIGNPIVLLADAHTVGGYPKIATVVSADLSLFALCRPGSTLRFECVDANAGREHTIAVEKLMLSHLEKLVAVVGDIDTARLLGLNLISGVTDALDSDQER